MTNQTNTMHKNDEEIQKKWDFRRELMLRFVPPIPGLTGVCLAGVSLISVHPRLDSRVTLLDDILAFNALLFIGTLLLILCSVKSKSIKVAIIISYVVDIFLFGSIIMLLSTGFLVFYTNI
jgi:hypothetical protein